MSRRKHAISLARRCLALARALEVRRVLWRRLPAAEREQLVLPAAGPAGSVIGRGPEAGRDDQQLPLHIFRRDTGITGKAASTDPAAICKDAGDVLEDRV